MELTLDPNKPKNFIRNYENNKIYIGKTIFSHNLLISDKSIGKWVVNDTSNLVNDDMKDILLFKPEIIIIGTGESQIMPSNEIINFIHDKKIGLEFMITESACKTFNLLISEGRKVVAGLIV